MAAEGLDPVPAPGGGQQQATAAPSNAVLAAATRVKGAATALLAQAKPWSELADRSAFSKPSDLAEATGRLRKNAAYFRINYALVVAGVTAAAMAVNPAALAVVALLGACWAWLFGVRTSPLVVNGRQFSEREALVGAAAASAVVVFFLTSVGTVLFTALGISVAAIAAHGATRVPDELFTDEIESGGAGAGGLLGLLTGGGGAVQAAASRAVAAAV